MADWILEDFSDNLDIRDTDIGIQIRHHKVVARHQQILANNIPSAVGNSSTLVDCKVGNRILLIGTIGLGSNQYICVADGMSPEEAPLDYVFRRQIWEIFTEWQDAPAGWNLPTP